MSVELTDREQLIIQQVILDRWNPHQIHKVGTAYRAPSKRLSWQRFGRHRGLSARCTRLDRKPKVNPTQGVPPRGRRCFLRNGLVEASLCAPAQPGDQVVVDHQLEPRADIDRDVVAVLEICHLSGCLH